MIFVKKISKNNTKYLEIKILSILFKKSLLF